MGLRAWASGIRSAVGLEQEAEPDAHERRLNERYSFIGRKISFREQRIQSVLHLRDMSCHGAAGMSDIPLAVGSVVFLQLRKPHYYAAEVRWVRNAMIGLQFYTPLEPEFVERLHAAHVADREGNADRAAGSLLSVLGWGVA